MRMDRESSSLYIHVKMIFTLQSCLKCQRSSVPSRRTAQLQNMNIQYEDPWKCLRPAAYFGNSSIRPFFICFRRPPQFCVLNRSYSTAGSLLFKHPYYGYDDAIICLLVKAPPGCQPTPSKTQNSLPVFVDYKIFRILDDDCDVVAPTSASHVIPQWLQYDSPGHNTTTCSIKIDFLYRTILYHVKYISNLNAISDFNVIGLIKFQRMHISSQRQHTQIIIGDLWKSDFLLISVHPAHTHFIALFH